MYIRAPAPDELYHWGIKGQRWGVRRFQDKNGRLTSAGKKRYSDNPKLDKQKTAMQDAKVALKTSDKALDKAVRKYQLVPTKQNADAVSVAQTKYRNDKSVYKHAKLKYETNKEVARIKDDNIEFKNKSKHRMKLEEQYRKMGMSKDQAEAAANNRIRTEKILAASAAVTVAACAAYVANKKLRSKIDGVIKAGEKLQRVEMQDTGGKLHDTFYAAKGKHDTERYKNLLGYARKQQTGHAYLMELQANSDIKVASKDKAIKAFGDLYKNDPDFKKSVEDHVGRHFAGGNRIKNLNDTSNRNIRKMYENFNAAIVDPSMRSSGADKKFYSKLKSSGYGAIQDINDMKYSGYNAKNPLIVFDNSNKNIMVKSVRELTGDLSKKGTTELLKATGESVAKDFVQKAGPLTAAGLTTAAVTTYRTDPSAQYQNQGGNSKWN